MSYKIWHDGLSQLPMRGACLFFFYDLLVNLLKSTQGQRYDIVIEANAAPGDYWIRTEIPGGPGGCGNVVDRNGNKTGILRYDTRSTALPTSQRNNYPSDCHDEPAELLKPILPWTVDPHPQNNVENNTYEAGLSEVPFHEAFRWDLTDSEFINL